MKRFVSDEEYQEALEKMAFAQNERKLLLESNQSKVYNAHIDLPGTFEELLINLKRKNNLIDEEIKRIKYQYLENNHYSKEFLEQFENSIFMYEAQLNQNSSSHLGALDSELTPEIRDLLQRKAAHTFLFNYIRKIEEEELEARKTIMLYEKQKRKKGFNPFKR